MGYSLMVAPFDFANHNKIAAQQLRTIIGKRFYTVLYIDEKNGKEYYNMVIES